MGFKPGQSGNPSGRTKGAIGWKRLIEQKAAETHRPGTRTWGEALIGQMFKAAAGRPSRLQMMAGMYLFDHLAGKAVQTNVVADMAPEEKKQLLENLLATLKEEKANGDGDDTNKLAVQ